MIERSGHQAAEADKVDDGLARVRELRPDIVIAGHCPPAMDGLETVRKIRAAVEDYRPYVILAAPAKAKAEWLALVGDPIDDLLEKPLQLDVVRAQLRAGQRIAALQRENERCQRKLQQYSTALTSSNLRLREMTITDDLTGLPNRRYSSALMQQEWMAASREDRALSCMVIDLDGLKQINDEQGHERGDVVLKTVAAIMRKYLPGHDTVCRTSGDEFLVICPGATLEAAMARGEKIVSLVASFNIHARGQRLGLSIGAAERRNGINNPDELLNLAEQAMHYAKRLGRNQVCSGHAAELRPVRAESPSGKAKKAKKQMPLWRNSDPTKAFAVGV